MKQKRSPEKAIKIIERIHRSTATPFIWNTKSLIPYKDDAFIRDAGYDGYSNHFDDQGDDMMIPIKKIVSVQGRVGYEAVIKKILGTDHLNTPEKPTAYYVRSTDTYHLQDGNHRTNAAILLREEFIEGRVITIDEKKLLKKYDGWFHNILNTTIGKRKWAA
jgi:hypothetical protein